MYLFKKAYKYPVPQWGSMGYSFWLRLVGWLVCFVLFCFFVVDVNTEVAQLLVKFILGWVYRFLVVSDPEFTLFF